jgi:hypothetical protein
MMKLATMQKLEFCAVWLTGSNPVIHISLNIKCKEVYMKKIDKIPKADIERIFSESKS